MALCVHCCKQINKIYSVYQQVMVFVVIDAIVLWWYCVKTIYCVWCDVCFVWLQGGVND